MRGAAAQVAGQGELAKEHFREALPIFAEVDDVSGLDSVIEHLARAAAADGDPRRAVRLAAAAARIRGISESAIMLMVHASQSGDVRTLWLDQSYPLTPEEVERLTQEGERMTTAEAVAYALAEEPAQAVSGLRVQAFGSMDVERDEAPLAALGGDKAGSRQAQAIFAFLFDRGPADQQGRGRRAAVGLTCRSSARPGLPPDPGWLRAVLEEGRQSGNVISYEGGRYRLAPELVDWSDVSEFVQLIDWPPARKDASERRSWKRHDLYRGDLFDDCPFYGDSVLVEERREYLRIRQEDLLIELGDLHAASGDEAQALALPAGPSAQSESARRAAIDRLGLVPEADAV